MRCKICVMDTSDPMIKFYGQLGCSNCLPMKESLGKTWFLDDSGLHLLEKLIAEIKSNGVGKKYDSIIGLSGGIDSAYLALKSFDWGLRPLVVHVDAGWNSEAAVSNIQAVLDFTGWELQTSVINWREMQDLQRSYLRSGVANQDAPQDHAYFASLYRFATQNNIKYILNGGNTATEGILPRSWLGSAMDSINLRDIQSKFGTTKLKQYPTVSFFQYYFQYPFMNKMRPVRPLNFIPYKKDLALQELESRIGFRRYPRKHGESIFTRIFQDYFLIERFGIDKRLAHLSSLIVSQQLTREEAMNLLEEDLYGKGELRRDIDYVCRKLEITHNEFKTYLCAPKTKVSDFRTWEKQYNSLKFAQRSIERLISKPINYFS